MKKLLILFIVLTSCSPNLKDLSDEETLPVKVIKSMEDSTLVFNQKIIKTDKWTYILEKREEKIEVIKRVRTREDLILYVIVGFLLGILVCLLFDTIK